MDIKNKLKSFPVFVLGAALLLTGCVAVTSPSLNNTVTVQQYTPSKLVADNEIIRQSGLKTQDIGYLVLDVQTGEIKTSKNKNKSFIPASTLKTMTALAALDILGADFRFKTEIFGVGEIKNDILLGDLYLVGGGDAMLSIKDLYAMAVMIKDLGIKKITGRFVVDDVLFKPRSEINVNQPGDAVYNTAVNALSFDFNRRLLSWRRGGKGNVYQAWMTPKIKTEALKINNKMAMGLFLKPTSAGSNGWIASTMTLNNVGEKMLPVKNPSQWTAETFKQVAENIGIKLPHPVKGAKPVTARTLATVQSPVLFQLIKPWLRYSNNLMAELIGLKAGQRFKNKKPNSTILKPWLKKKLANVDWSTFNGENYSGLSTTSRITPTQMASVLKTAWNWRFTVENQKQSFLSLLPVSGFQGSFQGRFKNPVSAGKILAKTGTMDYSSGIAGYVFTKKGRQLVFALNITDYDKRKKYDALSAAGKRKQSVQAHDWRGRAKRFEENLITNWIKRY